MPVKKMNKTVFGVSPSIAFGKGLGFGATASVGFSDGNFSVSVAYGASYQVKALGSEAKGWEYRKSWGANWDDGGKGLTLGTNFWSGSGGLKDLNQRTGLLGLHSGDFRATYENDGFPFGLLRDDLTHKALSPRLGDGYDSHRSAALRVSIGEYSLGFNIFTGKRDYRGEVNGAITGPLTDSNGKFFPRGYVNEVGTPHRLGALSFGYKGFNVGINSEKYVSYPIQARFAHGASPQGGFPIISSRTLPYFQYKTPNQFTLW